MRKVDNTFLETLLNLIEFELMIGQNKVRANWTKLQLQSFLSLQICLILLFLIKIHLPEYAAHIDYQLYQKIYNNQNKMQFVQNLQDGYIPEILCLVAQSIITGACILRIRDCLEQFPIRQLGPISSILCILCFYIANIINLIGKVYLNENPKIDGICKIRVSNFMFSLAILYNIIRQLPFVLFTIKTLRVSLCFWPKFNKINVEDIYKWFVAILKSQTYFTFVAICYVCLVNLLVFIIQGGEDRGVMLYQYFCYKNFSIIESVVSCIRVLTLCFVLYLSLWTYQELDFKKFLMTIFIVSNLSVLPHILNIYGGFNEFDRWPVYYVSFIVQILNSCMMLYYNGVEKELNQPAMQGVLQSWKAFHNLKLGMDILFNYTYYKDKLENKNNINQRCLESFEYLDELLKEHLNNTQGKIDLEGVDKILEKNQYVQNKLGEHIVKQYRRKIKEGNLGIEAVKKIQKILSNYCETEIFGEWKKTISYKTLKEQFINNGQINEKLSLFGIPVS